MVVIEPLRRCVLLERDVRELLGVEEVVGAQVGVPRLDVGVDAGGLRSLASTDEFSGCASSILRVASRSRKRPFTVLTTRCLTANSAIECGGVGLPGARRGLGCCGHLVLLADPLAGRTYFS